MTEMTVMTMNRVMIRMTLMTRTIIITTIRGGYSDRGGYEGRGRGGRGRGRGGMDGGERLTQIQIQIKNKYKLRNYAWYGHSLINI